MATPSSVPFTRRRLLGGATVGALTAFLAACGGQAAPPTTAPSAAPSAAPSVATASGAPTARPSGAATAGVTATVGGPASASPAVWASPAAGRPAVGPAAPVTPRTAAPRGELRCNYFFGGVTLNAVMWGFQLLTFGMAETLTRVTPENKLEPWLAESVTNTSPTTWRVRLRPNVRFWDNSPMDAAAVAASFRANWDGNASANLHIDKATTIAIVDPLTLDFTLPRPQGNFPNALSVQFFVVHKDAGRTMTGPYRLAKLDVDKEMVVEAFADHWGGPPPIARVIIRTVADPNTVALALQSGEVDLISQVLPETLSTFGPEIATVAIPSSRTHVTLLNTNRPSFADQKVREATAHAIDRAALLRVALGGQGEALATMFPTFTGFDQVRLQTFDQNRARQLLDEAGWRTGADGIRAKDGTRLAFTLTSYTGRPELTVMAVAMQAQLKAIGYDVQVREVQGAQVDSFLRSNDFDISMYSINALITGDPFYLYSLLLAKDGTYNWAKYEIPGMEPVLAQLRAESDPAKRQGISRQAQELVRPFVPYYPLVAAPRILAYRKDRVRDLIVHPNDLYFLDTALRVG